VTVRLAPLLGLAKEIAEQYGATGFNTAADQKEAEALWADRKNAHYAGLALMPGCKSLPTDVWLVFLLLEISWFPL